MKVIIINGFLGSGKTTFLKNLIDYLLENRHKIGVIVNDFGNICVDDRLISDLPVALEEIHSGSIFCSCKESEFIDKLSDLIERKPDYIVVEASGFSNPTTLDRIINFIENRNNLAISVLKVTICDATNVYKIIDTMGLVKNQIRTSQVVLLNKTDIANSQDKELSVNAIKEVYPDVKIIECVFCETDIPELLRFEPVTSVDVGVQLQNIALKSITVSFTDPVDLTLISEALSKLSNLVYRAKGYLNLSDGTKAFVELSSGAVNHTAAKEANDKLVVLYSTKITGADKIKGILTQSGITGYVVS